MPPLPGPGTAAVFFDLCFDPKDRKADFQALYEVAEACGASLESSWAGYEARELSRFKIFRHVLPETINGIIAERKKRIPRLHKLNTDLAVPDDRLRDMWEIYKNALDAAGLEWVGFGHIGNNHVHINVLPRSLEELEHALSLYSGFAEKAVAFGGAVSAEHGVGKMKKKFLHLMYSDDRIEQIRRVKRALDPKWLLNPGNMVDP
jgi:D-lactate dehydrogenase (cytochrome)